MNTEIVGKMKVSNQFSTLDAGFIARYRSLGGDDRPKSFCEIN